MDSGARRWEIALRTRLGHLNPQENFPGAWYASGGAGAARLPVGNRANSRPGFVAVGPNWPAGGWRSPGSLLAPGGGGWRSPGSLGGPGGGGWRSPGSLLALGGGGWRSPGSPGGPGGGGWRSPGSLLALAGGGWRSPGSPGGPGGGGWRSPGSLLALAGEGSGIRGDPSEFKGRPIARLNRIGNLRASVEEFLEFARRGSANGTPLEVDSGERFSSASGGPRGPPWNFSGRCAGHGG